MLARVKALQGFIATDDGANLLAGYKRAANILKIEEKKDAAAASSAVTPAKAGVHEHGGSGSEKAVSMDSGLREKGEERALEPAEAALIDALALAETEACARLEDGRVGEGGGRRGRS